MFSNILDAKRILREITLMRQLKHEYLIDLIEVLPPQDESNFRQLYVVMSLVSTDLKKLLKSNMCLKLKHVQTIIYNLICGIKFLHASNVLHRDLKPANILISEDCSIKLCDYGLARSLNGV